MSSLEICAETIKVHEGERLKPYLCPAGKYTIGYGRNLDDNGISKEESEFLLMNDINRCFDEIEQLTWFESLNEARQAAMIDMLFNLGLTTFLKFENMIQALEDRDYNKAAEEMLNSLWAKQVGQRAVTLANMIRTGEC